MKTGLFTRQNLMAITAVFVGIGVLAGIEMATEPNFREMTFGDMLIELIEPTILVITAATVVYLLLRTQRQHTTQMELLRSLGEARHQGSQWREQMRELLGGLGQAIDAQFECWGLTPAEREVGLLLLKGLSLREIAVMRDASERTVRQQASAVYGKAGLSGRAALSSYFLEDLLPPRAGEKETVEKAFNRNGANRVEQPMRRH
jgi:DNA-binding CsgD family transcriptional regulator